MDIISVVVPVYRAEAYLQQCVESIIRQTYSRLEIILVDDGSPDACPRMCDEYARKDARIKVIHKENGGVSDARNVGIEIATGEWIALVDSDDYMEPTMLQTLYDIATKHKADMAVCNVVFISNHERWTPEWCCVKNGLFSGIEILKNGHIPTAFVVPWNRIYKREIFSNISKYPVGRIHEDVAIAHEILGACGRIVCTDEKLYYYRQNPQGITKQPFTAKRLDSILAMADRVMYYRKNGLDGITFVLQDFGYELTDKYFRVDFSQKNHGKHKECLRVARKLLPCYISAASIPVVERILYVLFCLSPKLYLNLQKNKS